MILDDKQYTGSRLRLSKLNKSIARIDASDDYKDDQVKNVELSALKAFAKQIQKEVDEYEMLTNGLFVPPESYKFSELPTILTKTRISLGWSQQKLAELTETKLRHLQLYEEESYLGASYSKQMQVAEKLGIDTSACDFTNSSSTLNPSSKLNAKKTIEFDWQKFPVNEVIKRGWISKTEEHSIKETFKDWFGNAIGPYGTPSFHRKKISDDENTNKEAILTWEARILQLADQDLQDSSISDFELDERWLKDLVRITIYEDGPVLAKETLKQNGILLVIEKHLSGTHLDGAAMLSHEGVPIIGLTLRFDRLDYFWFTLFHELGHVFCHLYSNSNFVFFDQRSSSDNDETSDSNQFWGDNLEVQANKFALNKLIEPADWDTCFSRFSTSEKSVKADASRLGIHPSIIAGRIRNERSNFSILSNLIGQGMLHKHFKSYEK